MGKVCEQKGTARVLMVMSDYLQHLKIQHNYVSLKIRFQTMEFPHLRGQKHLADQRDTETGAVDKSVTEKDAEIAELKALLAAQSKQIEDT